MARETESATTIAESEIEEGGKRAAAPRYLVTIGPDGRYMSFPLPDAGLVTIGRSRTANIRIGEYKSLSRKHAAIRIEAGVVHLENLSERSKTCVRDLKLKPDEEVVIGLGEPIQLGPIVAFVQRMAEGVAPQRLDLSSTKALSASKEQDNDESEFAEDGPMAEVMAMVERVAASDLRVLIVGEPGAGKDWLARRIHELSPRRGERYEVKGCGDIPEHLFESTFFGSEEARFIGPMKQGLVELCAKGTLVLDDVGVLTREHQAKFLTFLEERTFMRVHGTRQYRADPRIVSTTNQDLWVESAAMKFRDDLLSRLATVVVRVPPLRERRSEIVPMARRFLRTYAEGRKLELSDEAQAWLMEQEWPWNVRGLKGAMERAAALAPDGVVRMRDLLLDGGLQPERPPVRQAPPKMQAPRFAKAKAELLASLERNHWVITEVAREQGVSTKTIYNRMKRWDIPNKSEKKSSGAALLPAAPPLDETPA